MVTKINKDEFLTSEMKTFLDVVNKTKGKGNNRLILDIITKLNCDKASELLPIARRCKNEGLLSELGRSSYCGNLYAIMREINKNNYCSKKHRGRDYDANLMDYKWYFKYVPNEYLQNVPLEDKRLITDLLTVSNEKAYKWEDSMAIYIWNNIHTLLNRDKYVDKMLVDRLFKNKECFANLLQPFPPYKSHPSLSYNSNNGKYYLPLCESISNTIYGYGRRNISNDIGWAGVTLDSNTCRHYKQAADLISQLYVLGMIMKNETVGATKTDDGGTNNFEDYVDRYILNSNRKTGIPRYKPERARVELFGQAKTLEMLITMGLGIRLKPCSNPYRYSNKKLNKRIQVSYKQFIKAKTVDERKSIRDLCHKQLDIIVNDFMVNALQIVELDCVGEQDKLFMNTASKTTVAKAPATGTHKKFDLNALASATTETLEKGR